MSKKVRVQDERDRAGLLRRRIVRSQGPGPKTPEYLARHGNVPPHWFLKSFKDKSWDMLSKSGPVELWWAEATWEPPLPSEQSTLELIEKLAKRSPRRDLLKKHTHWNPLSERHLLEVSIPDLHYGLLIWDKEGLGEYDFDIADRLFLDAISFFTRSAKKLGKIDRILFPIGNDYMHFEATGTTTSGTRMGDAANHSYAFKRGRDLLIEGITRLSRVAPVRVLSIPGNHDKYASLYMAMIVDAYFRNDMNVRVDASPSPYKVYEYGSSLTAFEHGRNIPPSRYAGMMAEMWPEEWARTEYHAWHLGDQHRAGGAYFAELSTDIQYLPSLAGINAWHKERSYSWVRGATAFMYNYKDGPIARLMYNLKPEREN